VVPPAPGGPRGGSRGGGVEGVSYLPQGVVPTVSWGGFRGWIWAQYARFAGSITYSSSFAGLSSALAPSSASWRTG
jgi:hypothetical protein